MLSSRQQLLHDNIQPSPNVTVEYTHEDSSDPNHVVPAVKNLQDVRIGTDEGGRGLVGFSNRHNVVHVVHTRFMQHQADLVHLGRARLELFRAFCLQSVQSQTSLEFLWILWLDPALPEDLRSELVGLVQRSRVRNNTVIVASNARIDDGYFRSSQATREITRQTIWHGDLDAVREYRDASRNRTLLETGLDADDALATTFVDDIQRSASITERAMKAAAPAPHQDRTWFRIVCAKSYSNWQFYGPYERSQLGSLEMDRTGGLCFTPGLTRISSPGHDQHRPSPVGFATTSNRDLSGLSREGWRFFVDHSKIKEHLPQCAKHTPATKNKKNKAKSNDNNKNAPAVTACYEYLRPSSSDPTESVFLRTRTPTSASMTGVQLPKTIDVRERSEKEKEEWERTRRQFGLDLNMIRESRARIDLILALVLNDAFAGLCTDGHSCMPKTKTFLERMRKATDKL